MAPRYSMTIQIDPSLPGHAAVVVNEPSRQTYAGFGPEHQHHVSDKGQFDVHTVQAGGAPPPDHSSILSDDQQATFTIPISQAQAQAAQREIVKIQSEPLWYNGWDLAWFSSHPRICTTIVNRIMEAAGLGKPLYPVPQANFEFLSDIANTLVDDPSAKVAKRSGLPIPDELRGLQRDYAFVGGGYDTPSERHGPLPSSIPQDLPSQGPTSTFNDRFGNWASSPNELTSSDQSQPTPTDEVDRKTTRYLRGQIAGPSKASVFDTGASPVPYVRSGSLSPQSPALFDDRFRNWGGSPSYAPAGRSQATTLLPPGNAPQVDPQSVRILSRVAPPNDAYSDKRSSSPSSVLDQAQNATMGRPNTIAPGQQALDFPFPPIFGLTNPSTASGVDMSDWFDRWVKPLIQD